MSDISELSHGQTQDMGNKMGGMAGIRRYLSGELVLVERENPLAQACILNFDRRVSVAAGRLVTAECFTKGNTEVKFGFIDEKIGRLFAKTEDAPAGELAVHTLLKMSHDPEVMVALGSQSKRFIKLGQFYQLIEAQGQGQAGPLLIDGKANIAYILDENGAPWAFGARWYPSFGGWSVGVCSVAGLDEWSLGYQVLSQVV